MSLPGKRPGCPPSSGGAASRRSFGTHCSDRRRLTMTMTVREAFERGTETFNAHDLDGFRDVLAEDVVFEAPGGARGQGKAACAAFFGSWFGAFPDAHVDVHDLHVVGDVAIEEGTFTGTHDGVLHTPTGDIPPIGRPVSIDYIQRSEERRVGE